MIWHQNERMQFVISAVTTSNKLPHQNFRRASLSKKLPPLPRMRRHEVNAGLPDAPLNSTHTLGPSGAKAPFMARQWVAAKAATHKKPGSVAILGSSLNCPRLHGVEGVGRVRKAPPRKRRLDLPQKGMSLCSARKLNRHAAFVGRFAAARKNVRRRGRHRAKLAHAQSP